MQQLPLDIRLADYALFETYFAGPNEACVHALRDVAATKTSAFVWLWGELGCGRSHLLQACVNAAGAAGARAVYLSLDPTHGAAPGVVEGIEACEVIAVDDVDRVTGDAEWERSLLLLYEEVRQGRGRLVVAADRAPLHCHFRLPDLVSRFSSGATFRVRRLADEDRIRAMQLRARWRGLELPDDVARYVIARVQRDTGSLFALLDRLDREALVAQRRLTVPFVRQIIGGG